MSKKLLTVALAVGALMAISVPLAMAGELDREDNVINVEQRAHAADLPGTVVVRVDQRDNSVAVLHSAEVLPTDRSTQDQLSTADYTAMMLSDSLKQELDRDSSASSWYFWFNNSNCYAPVYYYYGYQYQYQYYHSYSYSWYSYYYYRWHW